LARDDLEFLHGLERRRLLDVVDDQQSGQLWKDHPRERKSNRAVGAKALFLRYVRPAAISGSTICLGGSGLAAVRAATLITRGQFPMFADSAYEKDDVIEALQEKIAIS
jgi:hypothetical protein